MKIHIDIEPMGAVRMTRGKVNIIRSGRYDPNDKRIKSVLAYLQYKEEIGWTIKPQAHKEPFTGAIEASMIFYMPIPESWSGAKKLAHAGDYIPHISKPDIDNLEKGLYDAIRGIVFKDDSQIFKVREMAKYYSDRPRIECEFIQAGEVG